MPFVMNSSTLEEDLVDIQSIVLNGVEFNMSAIVYQNNDGTINIDDSEAEGL